MNRLVVLARVHYMLELVMVVNKLELELVPSKLVWVLVVNKWELVKGLSKQVVMTLVVYKQGQEVLLVLVNSLVFFLMVLE